MGYFLWRGGYHCPLRSHCSLRSGFFFSSFRVCSFGVQKPTIVEFQCFLGNRTPRVWVKSLGRPHAHL
jgi:hypothetical protein